MNAHAATMVAIALLCWLDAGVWLWQGESADVFAFIAFGVGYVALAFVFGGR